MNSRCKQLDVDIMKLVSSNGERHENIDKLTKKQGSTFIDTLNRATRGETKMPQEVLGYQENWRN